MELTSKTVHEVTFRSPKKSGLYVATDVDEFLETIATGLDALHEQLDAQKIRVTELEAQIAENAEQDAAIRKTLVLAQRTADMAIDEAKTESATLRENAAADVKRIREDAERDAASKRSGAEQEAARLIAETQGTLRADVSKLEEARSVLQSDVDALESFLANERQQLRAGLAQTLAALDAGIPLTGMRPAIHELDLASPAKPAITPTGGPSSPKTGNSGGSYTVMPDAVSINLAEPIRNETAHGESTEVIDESDIDTEASMSNSHVVHKHAVEGSDADSTRDRGATATMISPLASTSTSSDVKPAIDMTPRQVVPVVAMSGDVEIDASPSMQMYLSDLRQINDDKDAESDPTGQVFLRSPEEEAQRVREFTANKRFNRRKRK